MVGNLLIIIACVALDICVISYHIYLMLRFVIRVIMAENQSFVQKFLALKLKFDRSNKGLTELFIQQIEGGVAVHGGEVDNVVPLLLFMLEGRAQEWYTHQANFESFAAFKEAFLLEFKVDAYGYQLHDEVLACKQHFTSVEAYYEEFKGRVERLNKVEHANPMSATYQVRYYVDGLKPSLKQMFKSLPMSSQPTTVAEARAQARVRELEEQRLKESMEVMAIRSTPYVPPPTSQEQQDQSGTPISSGGRGACYICRERGHGALGCPFREVAYKAVEEAKRSKKQGVISLVGFGDTRPSMALGLEEGSVQVILDTGAEVSLIEVEALPEGVELLSCSQTLISASGDSIPVLGEVNLQVTVGGVELA